MEEEVKQVIVMRKDLHCRAGKTAAQVAHASMKAVFESMLKYDVSSLSRYEWVLELPYDSPLEKWLRGTFTKVVVYVESEKELFDIKNRCHADNIPWAVIIDAGKTEFHGEPTATCIAVGPDWSEKIDKITGDLPLL